MYYSQAGQDRWIDENTRGKTDGYFVDIGAFDGIEYSNTYFLEQHRNWCGICIEADITNFDKLKNNRRCTCENIAVYSCTSMVNFVSSGMASRIDHDGKILVCTDRLEMILDKNNAPKNIDYLSIDIEGCEFEALKSFPFLRYSFNYITIEHNEYTVGFSYKNMLRNLLQNNGYVLARGDVSHNGLSFEDWYINEKCKIQ